MGPDHKTVSKAVQVALKGEEPPSTKTVKKKLGKKEINYITFCENYYFLHNAGFPTPEQAALALGYTITEINYFLSNKGVQAALERRGLPWQHAGAVATQLTPTQLAAAITVMNFADERPLAQKLDELGVQVAQYNAWLENPTFKAFLDRRADANIRNVRPEAITQFVTAVRRGDPQMMKYYFEVTGEFKQQTLSNVQAVLQLLIESVQKHVKDPEKLALIANDMMAALPGIANGTQVNLELDSVELAEPVKELAEPVKVPSVLRGG